MIRRRGAARLAAALAALAGPALLTSLTAGCGYRFGVVTPDGVESVGIEYFGNTSRVRDLEAEFAPVLAREVTDRVPLPLREPDRADVVIRGKIVDYYRRGGIRSTENVLLERGLRIEVEAELVRRESGEVIRSTKLGLWGGYADDVDGAELEVRQRLLTSLAEALVLDLFRTGAAGSGAASG